MTSVDPTPTPDTPHDASTAPTAADERPTPQPSTTGNQRLSWRYYGIVALLVLGIVGATFAIGQRAGWNQIGSGGVNARLLPKVGEQAPDLFTFSANGEPMFLSALRGQPVWLNFWGSWCEPCQAEMPAIEAAYKELQPQGLVMLGISQKEDISQSVSYADAAGATFPIFWDPSMVWSGVNEEDMSPELLKVAKDTRSWQVNNQPTHVFIDRNGIVRAVVMSPMTEEQAVKLGEEILSIPYTGPALGPATPSASPDASPASSPFATPKP
ncbi:MAG: TlpA family protein disulfide reductase [Thermomicrobiales bacterium]